MLQLQSDPADWMMVSPGPRTGNCHLTFLVSPPLSPWSSFSSALLILPVSDQILVKSSENRIRKLEILQKSITERFS